MARPRTHGEEARVALLDAAELIVARSGPHSLTIRNVANEVGTTTRAVYSVFGSKGGLLAELASRAFGFLRDALDDHQVTGDPVADLEAVGVVVYRRFVLEHPSLYRIAFQRVLPELELTPDLAAEREAAFGRLEYRVGRLAEIGALRDRDVRLAAVEFNAMCEGLANAELRGGTMSGIEHGDEELVWKEAFQTVVRGLTTR